MGKVARSSLMALPRACRRKAARTLDLKGGLDEVIPSARVLRNDEGTAPQDV